jgi:hypothetical protein
MVNRKVGQAAMEYLMTYGWALLVIVIVIAILLIMNPFSTPQSCRFESVGFGCESPLFSVANSALYAKVVNGNNDAIKIFGVACTQSKSSTPPAYTALGTPVVVSKQDTYTVTALQCTDSSGVPIPANTLKQGSEFSGKLWVFYKNNEDASTYPVRSVSATLTTKATS